MRDRPLRKSRSCRTPAPDDWKRPRSGTGERSREVTVAAGRPVGSARAGCDVASSSGRSQPHTQPRSCFPDVKRDRSPLPRPSGPIKPGGAFSCPGPGGVYNIIRGPHKTINVKVSLLSAARHLINAPLPRHTFAGPDQTASWALHGLRPDVPTPAINQRHPNRFDF